MEQDVIALIYDAWDRVLPRLLDDPDELARRLERRRRPMLTRPPRAWCIAVRASDRRIEDRADIAASAHPSPVDHHPAEDVTLDVELLKHLSDVQFLRGQLLDQAARILGTTPIGLSSARIKGMLNCRYIPDLAGRHGKPIPLLSAKLYVDPNAPLFAPPDVAWSRSAHFLWQSLSADFSQTLTRIPVYHDRTAQYADKSHLHPEDPRVDPPHWRSRRLPPPPPDGAAWYKWKGDDFIGYDWRAAEKNPRIRINYERHERRKAKQRAYAKAHPKPSRGQGSLEFRGWKWLCPYCKKTCRTIFLPVPRIQFLAGTPNFPRLAKVIDIPQKLQGFACFRCHNLRRFSRVDRNSWNELVSYLSSGLLYGHEVPRPDWLPHDRKRAYAPRPTREPSQRRQQVLELLLKGLTYAQIAADLGVRFPTVHRHAKQIYKQHQVHGRIALAKKLGITLPPPHHTHTPARREQVSRLIAEHKTPPQIAAALGIPYHTVKHDIDALKQIAPDLLVRRGQRPSPIRDEIVRLHRAGLTRNEIAQRLSRTPANITMALLTHRRRSDCAVRHGV